MTELTITRSVASIAYVIVHDTGNFFLVDSLCTDAPGVSEPGLPGAPQITGVHAVNGGASVTWDAPADTGGSAIRSYLVRASPYANSDHFAPNVSSISKTVTGTSASFDDLLADCHQEYTFKVQATNSVGTGPSASSGPVRTSGYVTGPPPVVEIMVDGEGSAMNGSYPAFTPLTVPSYCGSPGMIVGEVTRMLVRVGG
jgi:hypothetical protein